MDYITLECSELERNMNAPITERLISYNKKTTTKSMILTGRQSLFRYLPDGRGLPASQQI